MASGVASGVRSMFMVCLQAGADFQEMEPAPAAAYRIKEDMAAFRVEARVQIAAGFAAIAEALMEAAQFDDPARMQVTHQQMLHASLVGIGVGDEAVTVYMRMPVSQAVEPAFQQWPHCTACRVHDGAAARAVRAAQVARQRALIRPETMADPATRAQYAQLDAVCAAQHQPVELAPADEVPVQEDEVPSVGPDHDVIDLVSGLVEHGLMAARSEERRVGRGWGPGWTPARPRG